MPRRFFVAKFHIFFLSEKVGDEVSVIIIIMIFFSRWRNCAPGLSWGGNWSRRVLACLNFPKKKNCVLFFFLPCLFFAQLAPDDLMLSLLMDRGKRSEWRRRKKIWRFLNASTSRSRIFCFVVFLHISSLCFQTRCYCKTWRKHLLSSKYFAFETVLVFSRIEKPGLS